MDAFLRTSWDPWSMPDIVEECNRFSREQGLWAGWTGLLALCMRQHHGAFSSLDEHVVEFAALTLHVAVVPALVLTLHGSLGMMFPCT